MWGAEKALGQKDEGVGTQNLVIAPDPIDMAEYCLVCYSLSYHVYSLSSLFMIFIVF